MVIYNYCCYVNTAKTNENTGNLTKYEMWFNENKFPETDLIEEQYLQ